jgi:hypothetical protein
MAAKDSDYHTSQDPGPIDEHVSDFETSARHQLLTKFQSHAQQDYGEGNQKGERPASDGQKRQQS